MGKLNKYMTFVIIFTIVIIIGLGLVDILGLITFFNVDTFVKITLGLYIGNLTGAGLYTWLFTDK